MRIVKGEQTTKPYISVTPTENDRKRLYKIANPVLVERRVAGALRAEEYHCTIVYSREKNAVWKDLKMLIDPNAVYFAQVVGADVFDGKGDSLALVLLLASTNLERRHTEFHRIPNVEWGYSDYSPHITLAHNPHKMPGISETIESAKPIYMKARNDLRKVIADLKPMVELTGEKLVDAGSDRVPMYQRDHWFSANEEPVGLLHVAAPPMAKFKLGVVGYSGQKFSHVRAKRLLRLGFDKLVPKDTKPPNVEIVSGYTDMGMPALAYRLASKMGYKTVGLSAAEALDYDTYPVDQEMIRGSKFGDESRHFLAYIDALLKVGGGKQSEKEFQMFQELYPSKPVMEYKLRAH